MPKDFSFVFSGLSRNLHVLSSPLMNAIFGNIVHGFTIGCHYILRDIIPS